MNLPPKHSLSNSVQGHESAEPEDRVDAEAIHARRAYFPPTLSILLSVEELLEILGPAQAGYGGPGMP